MHVVLNLVLLLLALGVDKNNTNNIHYSLTAFRQVPKYTIQLFYFFVSLITKYCTYLRFNHCIKVYLKSN